jgi:hypothetical protein
MKCQNCNSENRDVRKFCAECGAKLVLTCPKCGFENLPTEKFCGGSRAPLTATAHPTPKPTSSFDEKIARVQHYLPKELAGKILSQRDRIEGERKQVVESE